MRTIITPCTQNGTNDKPGMLNQFLLTKLKINLAQANENITITTTLSSLQ